MTSNLSNNDPNTSPSIELSHQSLDQNFNTINKCTDEEKSQSTAKEQETEKSNEILEVNNNPLKILKSDEEAEENYKEAKLTSLLKEHPPSEILDELLPIYNENTNKGKEVWKENWILKEQNIISESQYSASMLVPAAKERLKVLIGDKPTDEISELSEVGSLTPIEDPDLNDPNIFPPMNELLGMQVLTGSLNINDLAELIIPPPPLFIDNDTEKSSNENNNKGSLHLTENADLDINDTEMKSRRHSVIEFLAAVALGPVLTVCSPEIEEDLIKSVKNEGKIIVDPRDIKRSLQIQEADEAFEEVSEIDLPNLDQKIKYANTLNEAESSVIEEAKTNIVVLKRNNNAGQSKNCTEFENCETSEYSLVLAQHDNSKIYNENCDVSNKYNDNANVTPIGTENKILAEEINEVDIASTYSHKKSNEIEECFELEIPQIISNQQLLEQPLAIDLEKSTKSDKDENDKADIKTIAVECESILMKDETIDTGDTKSEIESSQNIENNSTSASEIIPSSSNSFKNNTRDNGETESQLKKEEIIFEENNKSICEGNKEMEIAKLHKNYKEISKHLEVEESVREKNNIISPHSILNALGENDEKDIKTKIEEDYESNLTKYETVGQVNQESEKQSTLNIENNDTSKQEKILTIDDGINLCVLNSVTWEKNSGDTDCQLQTVENEIILKESNKVVSEENKEIEKEILLHNYNKINKPSELEESIEEKINIIPCVPQSTHADPGEKDETELKIIAVEYESNLMKDEAVGCTGDTDCQLQLVENGIIFEESIKVVSEENKQIEKEILENNNNEINKPSEVEESIEEKNNIIPCVPESEHDDTGETDEKKIKTISVEYESNLKKDEKVGCTGDTDCQLQSVEHGIILEESNKVVSEQNKEIEKEILENNNNEINKPLEVEESIEAKNNIIPCVPESTHDDTGEKDEKEIKTISVEHESNLKKDETVGCTGDTDCLLQSVDHGIILEESNKVVSEQNKEIEKETLEHNNNEINKPSEVEESIEEKNNIILCVPESEHDDTGEKDENEIKTISVEYESNLKKDETIGCTGDTDCQLQSVEHGIILEESNIVVSEENKEIEKEILEHNNNEINKPSEVEESIEEKNNIIPCVPESTHDDTGENDKTEMKSKAVEYESNLTKDEAVGCTVDIDCQLESVQHGIILEESNKVVSEQNKEIEKEILENNNNEINKPPEVEESIVAKNNSIPCVPESTHEDTGEKDEKEIKTISVQYESNLKKDETVGCTGDKDCQLQSVEHGIILEERNKVVSEQNKEIGKEILEHNNNEINKPSEVEESIEEKNNIIPCVPESKHDDTGETDEKGTKTISVEYESNLKKDETVGCTGDTDCQLQSVEHGIILEESNKVVSEQNKKIDREILENNNNEINKPSEVEESIEAKTNIIHCVSQSTHDDTGENDEKEGKTISVEYESNLKKDETVGCTGDTDCQLQSVEHGIILEESNEVVSEQNKEIEKEILEHNNNEINEPSEVEEKNNIIPCVPESKHDDTGEKDEKGTKTISVEYESNLKKDETVGCTGDTDCQLQSVEHGIILEESNEVVSEQNKEIEKEILEHNNNEINEPSEVEEKNNIIPCVPQSTHDDSGENDKTEIKSKAVEYESNLTKDEAVGCTVDIDCQLESVQHGIILEETNKEVSRENKEIEKEILENNNNEIIKHSEVEKTNEEKNNIIPCVPQSIHGDTDQNDETEVKTTSVEHESNLTKDEADGIDCQLQLVEQGIILEESNKVVTEENKEIEKEILEHINNEINKFSEVEESIEEKNNIIPCVPESTHGEKDEKEVKTISVEYESNLKKDETVSCTGDTDCQLQSVEHGKILEESNKVVSEQNKEIEKEILEHNNNEINEPSEVEEKNNIIPCVPQSTHDDSGENDKTEIKSKAVEYESNLTKDEAVGCTVDIDCQLESVQHGIILEETNKEVSRENKEIEKEILENNNNEIIKHSEVEETNEEKNNIIPCVPQSIHGDTDQNDETEVKTTSVEHESNLTKDEADGIDCQLQLVEHGILLEESNKVVSEDSNEIEKEILEHNNNEINKPSEVEESIEEKNNTITCVSQSTHDHTVENDEKEIKTISVEYESNLKNDETVGCPGDRDCQLQSVEHGIILEESNKVVSEENKEIEKEILEYNNNEINKPLEVEESIEAKNNIIPCVPESTHDDTGEKDEKEIQTISVEYESNLKKDETVGCTGDTNCQLQSVEHGIILEESDKIVSEENKEIEKEILEHNNNEINKPSEVEESIEEKNTAITCVSQSTHDHTVENDEKEIKTISVEYESNLKNDETVGCTGDRDCQLQSVELGIILEESNKVVSEENKEIEKEILEYNNNEINKPSEVEESIEEKNNIIPCVPELTHDDTSEKYEKEIKTISVQYNSNLKKDETVGCTCATDSQLQSVEHGIILEESDKIVSEENKEIGKKFLEHNNNEINKPSEVEESIEGKYNFIPCVSQSTHDDTVQNEETDIKTTSVEHESNLTKDEADGIDCQLQLVEHGIILEESNKVVSEENKEIEKEILEHNNNKINKPSEVEESIEEKNNIIPCVPESTHDDTSEKYEKEIKTISVEYESNLKNDETVGCTGDRDCQLQSVEHVIILEESNKVVSEENKEIEKEILVYNNNEINKPSEVEESIEEKNIIIPCVSQSTHDDTVQNEETDIKATSVEHESNLTKDEADGIDCQLQLVEHGIILEESNQEVSRENKEIEKEILEHNNNEINKPSEVEESIEEKNNIIPCLPESTHDDTSEKYEKEIKTISVQYNSNTKKDETVGCTGASDSQLQSVEHGIILGESDKIVSDENKEIGKKILEHNNNEINKPSEVEESIEEKNIIIPCVSQSTHDDTVQNEETDIKTTSGEHESNLTKDEADGIDWQLQEHGIILEESNKVVSEENKEIEKEILEHNNNEINKPSEIEESIEEKNNIIPCVPESTLDDTGEKDETEIKAIAIEYASNLKKDETVGCTGDTDCQLQSVEHGIILEESNKVDSEENNKTEKEILEHNNNEINKPSEVEDSIEEKNSIIPCVPQSTHDYTGENDETEIKTIAVEYESNLTKDEVVGCTVDINCQLESVQHGIILEETNKEVSGENKEIEKETLGNNNNEIIKHSEVEETNEEKNNIIPCFPQSIHDDTDQNDETEIKTTSVEHESNLTKDEANGIDCQFQLVEHGIILEESNKVVTEENKEIEKEILEHINNEINKPSEVEESIEEKNNTLTCVSQSTHYHTVVNDETELKTTSVEYEPNLTPEEAVGCTGVTDWQLQSVEHGIISEESNEVVSEENKEIEKEILEHNNNEINKPSEVEDSIEEKNSIIPCVPQSTHDDTGENDETEIKTIAVEYESNLTIVEVVGCTVDITFQLESVQHGIILEETNKEVSGENKEIQKEILEKNNNEIIKHSEVEETNEEKNNIIPCVPQSIHDDTDQNDETEIKTTSVEHESNLTKDEANGIDCQFQLVEHGIILEESNKVVTEENKQIEKEILEHINNEINKPSEVEESIEENNNTLTCVSQSTHYHTVENDETELKTTSVEYEPNLTPEEAVGCTGVTDWQLQSVEHGIISEESNEVVSEENKEIEKEILEHNNNEINKPSEVEESIEEKNNIIHCVSQSTHDDTGENDETEIKTIAVEYESNLTKEEAVGCTGVTDWQLQSVEHGIILEESNNVVSEENKEIEKEILENNNNEINKPSEVEEANEEKNNIIPCVPQPIHDDTDQNYATEIKTTSVENVSNLAKDEAGGIDCLLQLVEHEIILEQGDKVVSEDSNEIEKEILEHNNNEINIPSEVEESIEEKNNIIHCVSQSTHDDTGENDETEIKTIAVEYESNSTKDEAVGCIVDIHCQLESVQHGIILEESNKEVSGENKEIEKEILENNNNEINKLSEVEEANEKKNNIIPCVPQSIHDDTDQNDEAEVKTTLVENVSNLVKDEAGGVDCLLQLVKHRIILEECDKVVSEDSNEIEKEILEHNNNEINKPVEGSIEKKTNVIPCVPQSTHDDTGEKYEREIKTIAVEYQSNLTKDEAVGCSGDTDFQLQSVELGIILEESNKVVFEENKEIQKEILEHNNKRRKPSEVEESIEEKNNIIPCLPQSTHDDIGENDETEIKTITVEYESNLKKDETVGCTGDTDCQLESVQHGIILEENNKVVSEENKEIEKEKALESEIIVPNNGMICKVNRKIQIENQQVYGNGINESLEVARAKNDILSCYDKEINISEETEIVPCISQLIQDDKGEIIEPDITTKTVESELVLHKDEKIVRGDKIKNSVKHNNGNNKNSELEERAEDFAGITQLGTGSKSVDSEIILEIDTKTISIIYSNGENTRIEHIGAVGVGKNGDDKKDDLIFVESKIILENINEKTCEHYNNAEKNIKLENPLDCDDVILCVSELIENNESVSEERDKTTSQENMEKEQENIVVKKNSKGNNNVEKKDIQNYDTEKTKTLKFELGCQVPQTHVLEEDQNEETEVTVETKIKISSQNSTKMETLNSRELESIIKTKNDFKQTNLEHNELDHNKKTEHCMRSGTEKEMSSGAKEDVENNSLLSGNGEVGLTEAVINFQEERTYSSQDKSCEQKLSNIESMHSVSVQEQTKLIFKDISNNPELQPEIETEKFENKVPKVETTDKILDDLSVKLSVNQLELDTFSDRFDLANDPCAPESKSPSSANENNSAMKSEILIPDSIVSKISDEFKQESFEESPPHLDTIPLAEKTTNNANKSVVESDVRAKRPDTLPLETFPLPTASCSKTVTPTSFKFLQPKRKLIELNQIMSHETLDRTPLTSQKTVIEEDVVKSLPSVKALAQAFLLSSQLQKKPLNLSKLKINSKCDNTEKKEESFSEIDAPSSLVLTPGTIKDNIQFFEKMKESFDEN